MIPSNRLCQGTSFFFRPQVSTKCFIEKILAKLKKMSLKQSGDPPPLCQPQRILGKTLKKSESGLQETPGLCFKMAGKSTQTYIMMSTLTPFKDIRNHPRLVCSKSKKILGAHFWTKYIVANFLPLIFMLSVQFLWTVCVGGLCNPISFSLFTKSAHWADLV